MDDIPPVPVEMLSRKVISGVMFLVLHRSGSGEIVGRFKGRGGECQRDGAPRSYGKDGADDNKFIILFLYLALHTPPDSHACSEDFLCVGLHPTEICRLHACLSLCVRVRLLGMSVVVMATLDHLVYEA